MINQIQSWLMQPKVWRIGGFASTIVGLLCYALSSSFNHLLGEWNPWKITLYCVFSFIICLIILFARVWQHSRTLGFKAHMAFLVLTSTSMYSFFDKAVQPDAYSLISCAAFAIMSLSLSMQTPCGFEVDLLYFFLGCFTAQLMKIRWSLGLIGAGFSYSLIILPSCLAASPEENVYLGLQDQPHVVIQLDQLQSNANGTNPLVITAQEDDTQVDSQSQQTNANSALVITAQEGDTQVDSQSQQTNASSALVITAQEGVTQVDLRSQQTNASNGPVITTQESDTQVDSQSQQTNASSASPFFITAQEGDTQVDSQSQQTNASALAITAQGGTTQVDMQSQQTNAIGANPIAIKPFYSRPQEDASLSLTDLQLLGSIKRLEEESQKLIPVLRRYVDEQHSGHGGGDFNLLIDLLPSEVIYNLKKDMKVAVAAGIAKEFYHLYSSCRREFLGELQQDFNTAANGIGSWLRESEIALKILFPNERRLWDRIFSEFSCSATGELSFTLVCREHVHSLLNSAYTFAFEKYSPTSFQSEASVLVALRDMIIPELESLFS